jgi:hypothetical protein
MKMIPSNMIVNLKVSHGECGCESAHDTQRGTEGSALL